MCGGCPYTGCLVCLNTHTCLANKYDTSNVAYANRLMYFMWSHIHIHRLPPARCPRSTTALPLRRSTTARRVEVATPLVVATTPPVEAITHPVGAITPPEVVARVKAAWLSRARRSASR